MVKVNKTNLNKSIDLVNQEKYEIQPSLLSSEAIEAAAAKLRKQASIRTRHPGVIATAVLTTTSSEEAKNAPQQDPRHVDLKPKEAYGNMRVKFLVDYAKATTELRESINHGYESIYDRFTKLLNDSPFKDLLIEWSQQQNAVPNNRHESILTTNLSLANNDDVAKKPKGTKRKKKQKSTIAESSCEGATNELNDTQLLTKLAAQTAQMLTNSTENLSISSSSLSSKKALDRTYQVQVKHTEVLVEKSTSQTSATVKLTAETCLKRTASKPQTKTRLESVDEDADSTLRSDNESASNQTQPITVKKKKVKNTAPSESSSMAELSRMPNPLASSSIMAAPVTKTTSHPQPPKTPKNSANSVQTAVNESGKVKKLVEVMEARIKATPGGSNTATATTTTTGSTTSGTMSLRSGTSSLSAAATVAAKRLQYSTSGRAAAVAAAAAAAIQQQAASSAAKLRSSIDKRKQRVSGSKAESKRASMRKVNALFKGLNETGIDQVDNASSKAATYEPRIAGVAPLGDDSTLSNASSSSGVGGGGKKPRDLLLGSAHLIQQNYKLSSAQKPLVPSSAVNTSATASARKTTSGFNKFLERNTPCKLTQTEIDEKRKELAAKEKKEQDRVIENKKQMMEKVEIAKKRREERMKKINDMRVQKEEEEKRKREEAEAEARLKQRELEEARKRMQEEKRQREEAERQYQVQQQIKAQQQQLQLQQQQKVLTASINSTNSSTTSTSVQKVTITQQATFIKSTAPPAVAIKSEPGVYDPTSTFKQPLPPSTNKPHQPTIENKPPVWNQNQTQQQQQQKTQTMTSSKTTPSKPILQQQNQQQYHHYQNNPPIKQQQQQPTSNSSANANNRRAYENYGVEDLHSGDETDDDEEPAKPIPLWAQDQNLIRQTVAQNKNFVNFTKIFRATSHAEVDLTSIFKIKRPKFTERSSSANWTTPPVWSTGINGDESFWVLHK